MADRMHILVDEQGKLLGIKALETIEGLMITIKPDNMADITTYTNSPTDPEEMARIEVAYKESRAAAVALAATEDAEIVAPIEGEIPKEAYEVHDAN